MEESLIALPFTLFGTEVGVANEVPALGFGLGVFVGHVIGILLGAIISAHKDRYHFIINGSLDSWRQQKKSFDLFVANNKHLLE